MTILIFFLISAKKENWILQTFILFFVFQLYFPPSHPIPHIPRIPIPIPRIPTQIPRIPTPVPRIPFISFPNFHSGFYR